jgi:hypothetical protein
MKPINILLSLLFISLSFSCTKDSATETEPTNTTETGISFEQSGITHKFLINNSNAYESIEFNASGNYIVVQNSKAEQVLFGTYNIIDSKQINLADFGTIIFTDLSGIDAILILKLNGSAEEISLEANLAEEVDLTDNSSLINRTWEVTSFGGLPVHDFYVFISAAGTYMVDNQFMGDMGISYGIWTWCNEDKTKLAFTLDDTALNCESINVIDEIEMTENSFSGTDYENDGVPMEMIMIPAEFNTKSSSNKEVVGLKIFGVER